MGSTENEEQFKSLESLMNEIIKIQIRAYIIEGSLES